MTSTIYEAAEAQGRAARGELIELEVPQWMVEGEPAKVYFYPGLTVDEWCSVGEHMQVTETGKATLSWQGCFECCRRLLRDSGGVPLFASEIQYQRLREKFDPVVLLDILNRTDLMSLILNASVEEAKKP